MKAFRYITAVAAITALAACNNDDLNVSGFDNDSDAVRISATVGNVFGTRSFPTEDIGSAKATQFDDAAQISVKADAQDAVTYEYTNPDKEWTPLNQKYLKWNTATQTFSAYYPAGIYDGTQTTVQPDQSSLAKIQQADYMKYEGDLSKPSNAPYTIHFEMQRQTARVIVDGGFSHNNELESLDGYTVSVKISDGTTTVTPYLYKGKYYALLSPTAADTDKAFITITLQKTGEADKEYIVRGIPELEKSYSYTYQVTIGKDKVEVGTVDIAPWSDGGIIGSDENMTNEI